MLSHFVDLTGSSARSKPHIAKISERCTALKSMHTESAGEIRESHTADRQAAKRIGGACFRLA